MSLLGVDVGSSALKAVAFSADDAAVLGSARHGYVASYPRPGLMELDPERVWQAFVDTVRAVAAVPAVRHDPVTAMALSVSCDEVIPADAMGGTLAPCIMAPDTRGADLLDEVAGLFPPGYEVYARTGLPLSPIHPLVRIWWYRRHEPAIAGAASRWLGWAELFLTRLGLPSVTDETTAGRWLAYDTVGQSWIATVLDAAGVASSVPSVVPVGTEIAKLGSGADLLGLDPQVTVVAGAFDQICTAIGTGSAKPGDVVVGSGTWENTTVIVDHPLGAAACERGLTWGPYVDDRYAALIMNPGGGSILRWFQDRIGRVDVVDEKGPENHSTSAPLPHRPIHRPTPLLFLPHVAGSLAPWRDPASKGAFVGLTLGTTRDEMYGAILEGITFELRLNLEPVEGLPTPRPPLRNTSGGSRSPEWVQLKADILGLPIATMAIEETGCLGAAILAGVGSGLLPAVESVQHRWCVPARVTEPDPAVQAEYDERFMRYRQLYPAIRELSAAL